MKTRKIFQEYGSIHTTAYISFVQPNKWGDRPLGTDEAVEFETEPG